MRKRMIGILSAVLLLVVGGVVWAVFGREDPAVQKVKELQKEAFAGNGPPSREKMEEFRQAMHELSPEQREKMHEGMRSGFERRMNQQIAGYFALPAAQRNAYLDKQINDMEKMRKEMEARFAKQRQGQGQGQNRTGPPQGQLGAGGGSPQGPNAGGPGGGGRNRTPEARMTRRNARLDSATPAQRAQRTAYFAALQKRRIELGLPAFPQHGHGPGRR